MESLLKEQDINIFLNKIERNFPNFVAGIITDKHGFPLASKIPKNFGIPETELALSAITTEERAFIKDRNFLKVKRNLGDSNDIVLFLLLQKTNKYANRFKILNEIVKNQTFF